MGEKLLITGTNGFVGKNLKEYFLSRGREVLHPVRQELDLRDAEAVKAYLEKENPATILHCAVVGGTRKTGYDLGMPEAAEQNLRLFFNLERCLKPGMRMINMGTGAEYDRAASGPKVREEDFDSSVPPDVYSFAKYVVSKYIALNPAVTSLRIFGMYGKYEDYTFKFISNAILKNLLGLPIVINQNVSFDYLWIEDFCAIVEKFLSLQPSHRHYNVTPDEPIDLLSAAELINAIGKNKTEIKVLNPGMNKAYTGSNSRLLAELGGWKFTAYRDGIARLYSYYESNLDGLDLETVRKDPYFKFCAKSGTGAGDKK